MSPIINRTLRHFPDRTHGRIWEDDRVLYVLIQILDGEMEPD